MGQPTPWGEREWQRRVAAGWGYDGVGVLSGAGELEAREEADELEGLGELLEGRLEGLDPLRLRGRD